MKILLLCPENFFAEHHGGVSTYILNLAEYLASQKHQVSILIPGANRVRWQRGVRIVSRSLILNSSNPQQHRSLWGRRKFFQLVGQRWQAFGWSIAWAYIANDFVREEGPFDVIETPEWIHGGLFIRLSQPTQKLVTKLHRSSWLYKIDNQLPVTLEDRVINLFEMISTLMSDGITSPNTFMLQRYRATLQFFKKPVRVIKYGLLPIQKPPLRKTPKVSPYLLFVGRIEKAKGCRIALEAFATIAPDFPKLKLLLIGEDTKMLEAGMMVSYRETLRQLAVELGLAQQIQFLTKKTSKQLQRYYDQALAVLTPSIGNENQPLVILEALRAGKVVVASRTGGIPEIITHKSNGLLFDPGQVDQFSQELRALLEQPSFRLKLEKGAQLRQRDYTVTGNGAKTLRFYQTL